MAQKTELDVNNDWLMAGILHKLNNTETQVTTSELKKVTGTDTTKTVTYRLNKLDEEGLVEIGQLSRDEWDHNGIPPKTAELTPDGREFVNSIDLSGWDKPDTMAHRIDRLEALVEEQQEAIEKLQRLTGVNQDDLLPSIVDVRAGYPAIKSGFEEVDVDVMTHTPSYAIDAARELEDE